MKKILKIYLLVTTFSLNFVLACSYLENDKKWNKEIEIQVKKAWKPVKYEQFAQNLATEINRLKNENDFLKNHDDVTVKINATSNDDVAIVQNVEANKVDLGFASISAIMQGDYSNLNLLIQTKTTGFKFDKVFSNYVDGNESDPLIKIAETQNQHFQQKPYALWTDEEMEWTGSRYNKFYDQTNLIDFYRGMIWISGTNEEKNKIKKAWENKNWNEFRNYGIIHGKKTSGGKFILQENLIKKHFGKTAFTTLAEDIQKNSSKYNQGKAELLHEKPNFKIVFDHEGTFAWTQNNDNKKFFSAPNMEILTVTEPLKYDIGFFRKNFHPRQSKIIAQSFINLGLAVSTKDIYGPAIGYNGYDFITNPKKEIIANYRNVINVTN